MQSTATNMTDSEMPENNRLTPGVLCCLHIVTFHQPNWCCDICIDLSCSSILLWFCPLFSHFLFASIFCVSSLWHFMFMNWFSVMPVHLKKVLTHWAFWNFGMKQKNHCFDLMYSVKQLWAQNFLIETRKWPANVSNGAATTLSVHDQWNVVLWDAWSDKIEYSFPHWDPNQEEGHDEDGTWHRSC